MRRCTVRATLLGAFGIMLAVAAFASPARPAAAEETRTLREFNSAEMHESALYGFTLAGRGQICATLHQGPGYLIAMVYDQAGNLMLNQEFRSTGCSDMQLARGSYQLRVMRVYGIWSLDVNEIR
jgi:hypothetical protein